MSLKSKRQTTCTEVGLYGSGLFILVMGNSIPKYFIIIIPCLKFWYQVMSNYRYWYQSRHLYFNLTHPFNRNIFIAFPHFWLNLYKIVRLCKHVYYVHTVIHIIKYIGIVLDTINADSQTTWYCTEMKITSITHH